MNILMVLTSHGALGNTGRKTGFWLEEFAAPYYTFRDAGVDVTLASPLGGRPPLDPKSNEPAMQTEATRRFLADGSAQRLLADTRKLGDVRPAEHDGIFYPGGHGPLWDLADDPQSIALIQNLLAAGKPVAAVCHGPAVLRRAKTVDGRPLVEGRTVTGYTNSEEEAVGLTNIVPFLVEDELKRLGGHFVRAPDWEEFVVSDGLLITGQNPASSEAAARALLAGLQH